MDGQRYVQYFQFGVNINQMEKQSLYLITGNVKKLEEFKQILGDKYDFKNENVDLPEIQGDPEEVAKEKVKIAYEKAKKPVIVEDTSLCFNAYKGLPGPYIKWFLKAIGVEGLAKMVEPFEDKTGAAVCILAYMGPELTEPKLFIGRTPGKIVEPRGSRDFGWDPNFLPDGFDQTYAQLPKEIKNTISHRFRAIKEMEKYFDEKKPQMKEEPKENNEKSEKERKLSENKEEAVEKTEKKAEQKIEKSNKKEQKSAKHEVAEDKDEQPSGKRETRSGKKSEKKDEVKTPKKEEKVEKSGAKSKSKAK